MEYNMFSIIHPNFTVALIRTLRNSRGITRSELPWWGTWSCDVRGAGGDGAGREAQPLSSGGGVRARVQNIQTGRAGGKRSRGRPSGAEPPGPGGGLALGLQGPAESASAPGARSGGRCGVRGSCWDQSRPSRRGPGRPATHHWHLPMGGLGCGKPGQRKDGWHLSSLSLSVST